MIRPTTPSINTLGIRLFSDGADLKSILEIYHRPWVRGFTTNPTLMRKAGVLDYEHFARVVLRAIPDRPISFEVFAEDELAMEMQALTIATWGANVNVKIPVTNQSGVFLGSLIRRLARAGVALNVTAVLTLEQVELVAQALTPEAPAIISVFAGRIADTGVDPVPVMAEAKRLLRRRPHAQLLWASPRELLNIFQADDAGCDIITVPPDILRKLPLVGKDLEVYSRETVEMFHRDAEAAAYSIDISRLMSSMPASDTAPREDDVHGFSEIAHGVVGAGSESTSRVNGI